MREWKSKILPVIVKGVIIFITVLLMVHLILENSSVYYKTRNFIWRRNYFLYLNTTDVYLERGEEFRLKLYALNKRASFSTTDFRVASVLPNGKIIALQPGKCFILVRVGEKVLKCRVHVVDLNKKNLTMKVGASRRLHIRGTNAYVKWSSANPRVAEVSAFGTVKAKKKGNTIIYATVRGKTVKCVIRVK